jgi:carboxyl-terminal processing protease
MKPANITISLFTKNLIFDYATLYAAERPVPVSVEALKLDDTEYGRFIDFLKGKDYDYKTESDDKLEELIKTAKEEKYFQSAEDEFNDLKTRLAHDKDTDLQTFRKEIKSLLYEEIASRYFYQKGRILASFNEDPELAKAIEVLKDPLAYIQVLDKSFGQYKTRAGMSALNN